MRSPFLFDTLALVALAALPASAQTISGGGNAAPRAASRRGPPVLYVDALATGMNDGSSWRHAYRDLQDALVASAAGGEVWVAAGTYTPSDTDATVSFVLPSGVGLYGGFNGTETHRDQRDWLANPTTLSGDIGHDDVVGSGPGWYWSWNIHSPNSGHVVDASGVQASTVIDGFTIANGHTGPAGTPAGDPLMFGGGIYAVGGDPTVRNCTFTHNLAAFASGGGMYVLDGNPRLEGCRFLENYAHVGGGGAFAAAGASTATFTDCEVTYNQAVAGTVSAGDGDGAGIFVWSGGQLAVERTRFHGNVARPFYSVGDEVGYGGAICTWGPAVVRDCEFTTNRATWGAGMITFGDAEVVNCRFTDNVAVPQPNDPWPEIGGYGAGLVVYSFAPAELVVTNCTFAANDGKKFVALWTNGNGAHATIENSILFGNHATHPEVVGFSTEQLDGDWSASYSCIAHVFEPKEPGGDPPDPDDLRGCVDLEPLFVSEATGDWRLAAGSPCIDAGDNTAVPPGVTTDLEGLPRFVDDPAAPDVGNGVAPLVDMGAHERQ